MLSIFRNLGEHTADTKFISNFLKWKSPLKPNLFKIVEQCFAVNFGSTKPFDLPTLSLDLESNKDFQMPYDISTNHCFLVFVGGNYVEVIEEVMKKVDSITKDIVLTPLAIFVTTKEKIQKDLPVTAKIAMVK